MSSMLDASAADPLPMYTPRQLVTANVETLSIRSGAPSYTSDAPSYHSSPSRRASVQAEIGRLGTESSSTPSNHTVTPTPAPAPAPAPSPAPTPTGLPRLEYAPGFRRCHENLQGSSSPDPCCSGSNSTGSRRHDSRTSLSSQVRVRRLTSQGSTNPLTKGRRVIALSLDSSQPRFQFQSSRTGTGARSNPGNEALRENESFTLSPTTGVWEADHISRQPSENGSPTNSSGTNRVWPEEDPELVGPEAAAMARSRRLYLAAVQRGFTDEEIDAMRKQESKQWDFMISQMADWDERERNWNRFKSELRDERSTILGRARNSKALKIPRPAMLNFTALPSIGIGPSIRK